MSESEPVYFDDDTDEPQVVELIIATRKPGKWRFVDLETGQIWKREGEMFVRVQDTILTVPVKELSEGGASDSG